MKAGSVALVLIVNLFAVVACGATFYVSTSGSDGGSGSSDLPWLTIQHAVDNISPGDVIVVRAGTYAGARIENSGLASAHKTLRADTGASVILNAPGPNNKHTSILEVENFSATVRYWIIDGFEMTNAPRSGVDIRVTEFVTIQNCIVHDSGRTGIFTGFSNHPLILNNTSFNNGEHGIYHSDSGDFPIIRGNKIHHNFLAGIHMNGGLNEGGDGIISYATVDKNVIWENGVGGASAINCDGVDNSLFMNNLMYSNHASGISLYGGDGAHGSSGNKVYNNTIVMASFARYVINIPPSDGTPNPVGNQIVNNILYGARLERGSELILGAVVPGFVSDNNIVVDRFTDDGGNSLIPLTAWQSQTGQDLHSIISDPTALFVDPANNDYHLKAGSPAVNAGARLTIVSNDIDGTRRPQGGLYDIGCYESH